MSLAVLGSQALVGLDSPPVYVETHLGPGLPMFSVVGMADVNIRESRERVRAAIVNSGFEFPCGRITVNLSPADVRKESARFDLPIALGVLLASGQVEMPELKGRGASSPLVDLVFAGELSLSGVLVPVAAPLALALGAARARPGVTLIMPPGSAQQAAHVPGIQVLVAASLADVVAHLTHAVRLPTAQPAPWPAAPEVPCLSDVRGQAGARRALEVAAAGGHSLLMVGPPGAGKSMLAQRLPGLLPPLPPQQALEVAAISGLVGGFVHFGTHPPFRAPHHSASCAALVGGGTTPRPGEISLAHHGVLFLDELPEFSRRSLEALREPLEAGRVVISRASGCVQYPARFQLVAAMNPCPCGFRGHPTVDCRCSPDQATRYRSRISGPLLDRIDLCVELPPSDPAWMHQPTGETSEAVRQRVAACRERQLRRQGKLNAALGESELKLHCPLTSGGARLLNQALTRLHASARVAHRALRVARTAADLAEARILDVEHVAEGVQYRFSAA
jgi:magnesium chelatase family protein